MRTSIFVPLGFFFRKIGAEIVFTFHVTVPGLQVPLSHITHTRRLIEFFVASGH